MPGTKLVVPVVSWTDRAPPVLTREVPAQGGLCTSNRLVVPVLLRADSAQIKAPTARRCRRTNTIRTAISFSTTPRGGATPLPRRAQPLLLLFRSNPPLRGGKKKKAVKMAKTQWSDFNLQAERREKTVLLQLRTHRFFVA